MRERRTAAAGLVIVALAIPGAFLFEVLTRPEGTDGDNPAESLVYLQEHGTAYALSGACFLVAAFGLIAAATSFPDRVPFTAALGSVGGGLWVFTGALRLSSPGPIAHIEEMRASWGESAYLVVQMAGTQAGLLGGAMCFIVWMTLTSALAWRRRCLPRWLAGLGVAPIAVLVLAVLGPAGVELPEFVWLAYVAVLVVGLPLWLLGSAAAILGPTRLLSSSSDRCQPLA